MPFAFQFQGELLQPGSMDLGDTHQHVREPGLRSTSFILAVTIRVYITVARRPPRSEPARSHDFLPQRPSPQCAFGRVVGQARAFVLHG